MSWCQPQRRRGNERARARCPAAMALVRGGVARHDGHCDGSYLPKVRAWRPLNPSRAPHTCNHNALRSLNPVALWVAARLLRLRDRGRRLLPPILGGPTCHANRTNEVVKRLDFKIAKQSNKGGAPWLTARRTADIGMSEALANQAGAGTGARPSGFNLALGLFVF